ncbi:hypothetical protein NQ152_08290 [Microbacterium sp. zg.B48]|uniref:hypothetical protein n=1 Tax=Microbacterium sp. zg.B48 TaxID=2969408 RepID=UPI00214B6428|nr:hypothetical protein [Microbacterium sp. zg.B48]MCR2763509.1 hypothetical protein [Microbacterium sp. zg.B48]
MAAHVLRLRIALLLGALRGDSAHVTRVLLGLLLLAMSAVTVCWAILTLRDARTEELLAVTVLGGSAVTLGFALAPLIAGATDPLDPRRFVVLGLPAGRLAAVLGVAGFLSVPTLVLVAVGVCAAVVWAERGVPGWAAGLGVVLGVATCVLLARVCMALTALFSRGRRSRELAGVFALVVLVVAVPVAVFLGSLEWRGQVPPQLAEAVSILALTPLGAAWALPGALAQQQTGAAGAIVLIAAGTLLTLGLIWFLLVRRLLSTTDRPVSVHVRGGLGWFAVAPRTAGGAIAARSLIYWLRDLRYVVNIAVIPVAAVLTTVPLLIAGVPPQIVALVPVPIIALFLGWFPHNDVAYDSTAIWMHIASGIRGVSDRVGRLVPVLLIGIPLLAIGVPIAVALNGRWALLPAMAGVCAALFLTGLGLSSISSVAAPYAVSRPGESPFQQPQRVGAGGAIAQAVVMLGGVVLSAPALWWAWLALNGDPEAATLALWGGLAIGAVVLIVGIAIGSAVFRQRGGRLMEFAESV